MKKRDENDPDTRNQETNPEFKGIFITEGASLTIKGLKLQFGPDGPEISQEGTVLSQDLCRHWLRIARRHIEDSHRAHQQLLIANQGDDEESLGLLLEQEFQASMQGIVAAAIALDAFYASVKDCIDIPDSIKTAWRENRTARWRQMGEVFRLAFGLDHQETKELRSHLRKITEFRDWAIHPPADKNKPELYSEISRAVEWRFVAFRHRNASAITGATLGIVNTLLKRSSSDSDSLKRYCDGLIEPIEKVIEEFKQIDS